MKFSNFKTDPKKEEDGIWFILGHGLELKVARAGNIKYRRYLQKLTKPHQAAFQSKTIEDAVVEDITLRAIANYILLDWKQLEEEDGTEIPYSPEKAKELFEESADFLTVITDCSNDRERFGITPKQEEEDLEN